MVIAITNFGNYYAKYAYHADKLNHSHIAVCDRR